MSLSKRLLQSWRAQLPDLEGSRVAVAVSGGLDSVVLLELLVRIRRALGVELVVAHLDHGMRGTASASDAAFVRALARDHGLPCYGGRAIGLQGDGIEDAARRARLDFLRGVPARCVALAHHRDDQAETVLLRLLRSASPWGLGGMAPARGRWLRPLLGFGRDELRTWAVAQGLRWREDASNDDQRHARNRLRHRVMPSLDSLHGGVAQRLAAMAAQQRQLLEALPSVGAEPAGDALAIAGLRELPAARRTALLRAHVEARCGGLIPDGAALARMLTLVDTPRPGAWVPLGSGWRAALGTERLFCLPPAPAAVSLRLPGRRRWGVHDVTVDRDLGVRSPVVLRPPREGERFGGQALEEWLRRRGVPAALRPYHPVFAVEDRVAWVPCGEPLEGFVGARGLAITVTASIPTAYAPGRPWTATL